MEFTEIKGRASALKTCRPSDSGTCSGFTKTTKFHQFSSVLPFSRVYCFSLLRCLRNGGWLCLLVTLRVTRGDCVPLRLTLYLASLDWGCFKSHKPIRWFFNCAFTRRRTVSVRFKYYLGMSTCANNQYAITQWSNCEVLLRRRAPATRLQSVVCPFARLTNSHIQPSNTSCQSLQFVFLPGQKFVQNPGLFPAHFSCA